MAGITVRPSPFSLKAVPPHRERSQAALKASCATLTLYLERSA
jgi:hypothetical protein